MKKLILVVLVSLCASIPVLAWADLPENKIKTCSTVVRNLDTLQPIPMLLEVYQDESVTVVDVTQTVAGVTTSNLEKSDVFEDSIRAGLTSKSEMEGLNRGELLIAHAMMVTEDPEFQGIFNAGLDLTLVRKVKVFLVGEPTGMGMPAIVEAKDAKGKLLGSFFGGFLVSPCK